MAPEDTRSDVKTVVIIGAGAAGLQAANVLLESTAYINGRLKIIILEARDRVGGRILIERRWGTPFDCGPNWIHGTFSNPLMAFTKSSGAMLTFPDEGGRTISDSSGIAMEPEVSRKLFDRIWRYAEEAINFSVNPGESIPPEWSMYDFCLARISEDKDLDHNDKMLAMQLVHLLTTFTAVDVRKQSLRHYQVEAGLAGESPFVASTFEFILNQLAERPVSAGIVHLSTPVSAISMGSHYFEIQTPITTFYADAVIVTIPLGCLQRETITFNPPLPVRVRSAIRDLGFGNLEKIFLRFERAWWLKKWSSEAPELFTFLPPLSLPADAPDQLLNVFSLATLPVNAQPVLAVYTAGEWSTYLATKSDEEIADLFETYFLPSLPNFTSDCIVTDVFRTDWAGDPFAYGSYTHVPTGSEDGIDDLRILGERIMDLPKGNGGLWFAGEHAGRWDLATVNGAMTSGTMAALDVWKTLEK